MKLQFTPLIDNQHLVSERVFYLTKTLAEHSKIQVAEINPEFADGLLLSREYDIPLQMELNCLIVEGIRQEQKRYAAIVLPYGKRVNTGSVVKQQLDAKKVSFAPLDYVLEATKMEFGSITPIGLPDDWLVLVDSQIVEQENIIIGSGLVKAKIMMPVELLLKMSNVIVLEGMAKD